MKAYGYKVNGSAAALADVAGALKNESIIINWFNFNTGDIYWGENGERYKVEVDHETKRVTLYEE